MAHHLPPVCPQKLPLVAVHGNTVATNARMSKGRQKYWSKLWPYLRNESEDCLYLNVYVPVEENELTANLFQRKHLYPVIVYIHGESFEWNAGNAYDGSVLSSYGEVIVVTVNYRLGVLGKVSASSSTSTSRSSSSSIRLIYNQYGLFEFIWDFCCCFMFVM